MDNNDNYQDDFNSDAQGFDAPMDGAYNPAGLANLRIPPHSLQAEEAVIGAILTNNRVWYDISSLKADDFYKKENRIIFEIIKKMISDGDPVDIVTLHDRLESEGKLNDAGGQQNIANILYATQSSVNATRHAKIVKDKATLRLLVEAAETILSMAYHPEGKTTEQILDVSENLIYQISQNSESLTKGFTHISDILPGVFNRLQELSRLNESSDTTISGLSTGFIDYDLKTGGLQKGDLVIVAGRPGMGKTTFAMNIAQNIGFRFDENVAVGIFTMEMPAEQLILKIMAAEGNIELDKLRNGRLNKDDWKILWNLLDDVARANIYIDETSNLTPLEVRSRSRRLASRVAKNEQKLGLIVLDYLQLMTGNTRTDSRVNEIAEISRSLKQLAKELEIPVIALSQLSRKNESRETKVPLLSDLRDSGAIEQDADIIVFIHRDAYYDRENAEVQDKAQAIIAKHRNGPTGEIDLVFSGRFSVFRNAAKKETGAMGGGSPYNS